MRHSHAHVYTTVHSHVCAGTYTSMYTAVCCGATYSHIYRSNLRAIYSLIYSLIYHSNLAVTCEVHILICISIYVYRSKLRAPYSLIYCSIYRSNLLHYYRSIMRVGAAPYRHIYTTFTTVYAIRFNTPYTRILLRIHIA